MIALDLPSPRPTLKSIAYAAGLGITTVSRALRNDPEIASETRARVQLLARQVGYRPNRAGVRLKTGRTNVITVVLNPGDDGSGFFANFVYGISDALAGTAFHLVVTPYSLSDSMAPVRYIVETGSADGVILSRIQPDDPRVRYLAENGVRFATHGRTDMGIVHPFHDFDNEAFARLAVSRLAAKGRKRLALLGPPAGLSYHRHAHQGFAAECRRQGLSIIALASADTDTSLENVRAAVRDLAKSVEPPDGLVSTSAHAAFAVVAGFEDQGLKIGRDFDVVTKHSADLMALMNPDVIAIPEDFREAGRDTARMVMAWIAGEPPDTLQRLLLPDEG